MVDGIMVKINSGEDSQEKWKKNGKQILSKDNDEYKGRMTIITTWKESTVKGWFLKIKNKIDKYIRRSTNLGEQRENSKNIGKSQKWEKPIC